MIELTVNCGRENLRLVLSNISPTVFEAEAITWLRERGYVVDKPTEWEKPAAFCQRIGITTKTLIAKLRDPRKPHVDIERANGRGRLLFIASNKQFNKFCTRSK